MKAAFIEQPGPPENIKVGELPVPEIGPGQVLVKVGAVAVNPIDTYIRSGAVAMALPKPFVVGCDAAGTIEQVAGDVTDFEADDRVWCSNQGLLGRQGTFAEYIVVDACWLQRTPENVTDEAAAATALVGITAHIGVCLRARLQAGETIFVNGGAGGVGSMVVQIAKAIGARVVTTAGSDERVAKCRELGADLAINYRTGEVAAKVAEFAPDGVNVFWETRREADFVAAVPMLAKRGRFVVMAGRDARPLFPVGPFYVKDCELHGFAMFNYSAEEQRPCGEDLNVWLAAGKVKANIDRFLPLDEAAAAHRLQEENTVGGAGTLAGKIVLKP
jgi:NADPH2:quinone reductase